MTVTTEKMATLELSVDEKILLDDAKQLLTEINNKFQEELKVDIEPIEDAITEIDNLLRLAKGGYNIYDYYDF